MKRHLKRQSLIRSLKQKNQQQQQEINRLNIEIGDLSESLSYYEDVQYRADRRNQELREENNRIERQRQMEADERSLRDYERQNLMKKLERAESWGDAWGVERIKKQLKNY